MKRLVVLVSCFVACFVCCAAPAGAADLSTVRNVYLLKMGKGLDQFLANRLTNDHVFQVVTDPKLADAILTDQIGEGFEAKLGELYPPPEPEKPAKVDKPVQADKSPKKDEEALTPLITDTVNKLSNPGSTSSFGRAKGMVFLVDAKTKQVIWSAFEEPKDSSAKSLDRTATDIVSRIKKDRGR
jgi:hypothetical protein